MKKELKEFQVYLVIKGFFTGPENSDKGYIMYGGNYITILKDAKNFNFTVPVEGGYSYSSSLQNPIDEEFEDMLLNEEYCALIKDNLFEELEDDESLQTVIGDEKLFIKKVNGDLKFYKSSDWTNEVSKEIKLNETDTTLNSKHLAFFQSKRLTLEEIVDGDILVEVYGDKENRGHQTVFDKGKISVIVDREKGKIREGVKLTKEMAPRYVIVRDANPNSLRYKFKSDSDKPKVSLFSEEKWFK